MIVFYILIVLYVFFGVVGLQHTDNLFTALLFELIGFLALAFLLVGNIALHYLSTGYFVPLIFVTVVYTILLDTLNFLGSAVISPAWFMLIHLALLFVYLLVSIPMYIMGKNK